jgi:hypothetical protein
VRLMLYTSIIRLCSPFTFRVPLNWYDCNPIGV